METYQSQCGQLNHLLVQAFHTLVNQDQEKEHGQVDNDDQRKKVKKKKKKKDKEKDGEKQVKNGKHGTKKNTSKKDKKKSHKHEDNIKKDNIKKDKSKDSKNKEVKSDSHYSSYEKSYEKSSSYNKYNDDKYDDKYYDDKYYKNDHHHSSDKYSYKNKYSDENYYYGSYYEGDRPSRSHKSNHDYSYSSNYRSRSRSPFYKGSRYHDGTSARSFSSERTRRKHKKEKREKVDKVKLLEIARENLAKMIEKGDLPKGTDINKLKLRHLRELTTQKSVQQWTEFCKAISQLESAVCSDSDVDPDSEEDNKSIKSDYLFPIRHPFKLKEKKDIEIKVRDFINLKCRSASELAIELRQQFPVSSGNQHRRKEDEWTEVEPLALPAPVPVPASDSSSLLKKTKKIETPKFTETKETKIDQAKANDLALNQTNICGPNETQTEASKEDSVFQQSNFPIDIGTVMAQRLSAMKKLEEDPHNVVALKQMYQAQEMVLNFIFISIEIF